MIILAVIDEQVLLEEASKGISGAVAVVAYVWSERVIMCASVENIWKFSMSFCCSPSLSAIFSSSSSRHSSMYKYLSSSSSLCFFIIWPAESCSVFSTLSL